MRLKLAFFFHVKCFSIQLTAINKVLHCYIILPPGDHTEKPMQKNYKNIKNVWNSKTPHTMQKVY